MTAPDAVTIAEHWARKNGVDFGNFIASTIDKYGLGLMDLRYQITYGAVNEARPDATGTIGTYSILAMQIAFAARGALLGADNDIWYFLTCKTTDTKEVLDKSIMDGMENLRTQKAAQLNGASSLGLRRPEGGKAS